MSRCRYSSARCTGAAHRDVLAHVLAALGQHDAERARGDGGVLEELVEVAHPVPEQAVRVGGLDLEELRHRRRRLEGAIAGLERRGRAVARPAPGPFPRHPRLSRHRVVPPLETRDASTAGAARRKSATLGRCRRRPRIAACSAVSPDLWSPAPYSHPDQFPMLGSQRRASPRRKPSSSTRRASPATRDHADEAAHHAARPVARLFAGRRRAGEGDRRDHHGLRYRTRATSSRWSSNGARHPRPRQPRAATWPVMEGKGALFKRFADIDRPPRRYRRGRGIHQLGALLGPSFGGINLEDIKALGLLRHRGPAEEAPRHSRLPRRPARHGDRRGRRHPQCARTVKFWRRRGAAALACLTLLVKLGLDRRNLFVSDIKGVVYEGRTELMDEWKAPFARATRRSLAEIIPGADIFLGLSAGRLVARNGGEHGRAADHLRHGQPGARDHA